MSNDAQSKTTSWARGSGRTTVQMKEAPADAVFVWPAARSRGYAQALTRHLERLDLEIVTPSAFDPPHQFRGRRCYLVIDHAVWDHATPAQVDGMERVLKMGVSA